MSGSKPALAEYLRKHQPEIVDRWLQYCEADDALGVVSKLTREEFRDNMPAAIDALCRTLERGDDQPASEAIRVAVGKHGHHRWKQGFSLRELIRDWGHFNRVLIRVVDRFYREAPQADAAEHPETVDLVAQFITEATTFSVRRFDDLRRAEAAALEKDLELVKEKFAALTQARGQLLREAAHDIRGNLSAVATASAVLKSAPIEDESLIEMYEVLEQGVSSVNGMLDSLLDLSRLESGADQVVLESADVAAVLQQLAAECRPLAEEKDLILETDGVDELVVQTDPEKVRRIAQNLLVNAVKYTASGNVELSWAREEDRWTMQISDTGPGMQDFLGSPIAQEMNDPESHRSEPTATDSHGYAGEGIGLTIVKRLCGILDAGISLESDIGQGSTFTVQFPLEYEEWPEVGN